MSRPSSIIKEHGLRFLQERYWEERQFFRPPLLFRITKCIDRNKKLRKKHEFDKDGRCIFCDYLRPGG